MGVQIEIQNIDVLSFEGDGVVVPIISTGEMETPLGVTVRDVVGMHVQEEVMRHAPIAVGACTVTEGGPLKVRHIIHSPVLEEPGLRIGVENIRRSVRAGILGAAHFEMERVGIPAFGYDEAGVSYEETARAIIDEITGWKQSFPTTIVLFDENKEMYEAFGEQKIGGR